MTRRQMAVLLERAMKGTLAWTPGDATAVRTPVGSGLAGGTDSGDVSLGIASQGVLTEHIGNLQVTQAKLAAQPSGSGLVLSTDGTNLAWAAPQSGPTGATGPQGLVGDTGPVGATGASGLHGPPTPGSCTMRNGRMD